MPILVNCPSCKAEFKVSEKYAGKQGPCPKCKATITVPKLPASDVEVKIHAPEGAEAPAKPGKSSAPRSPTRPIAREETRVHPVPTIIFSALAVAAVLAAWLGGERLAANLMLRAAGLLLLSPPIALVGYTFLRNDELAPYRGLSLWLRAGVCGLVYTGLWWGYTFIPDDFRSEVVYWVFMAPPFFVIGAGTALICFELEIGNGFFHYCFYLLLTLGLGWLAGLEMPWQAVQF